MSGTISTGGTANLASFGLQVAGLLTQSGDRAYSYHMIGAGPTGIPDVDPAASSAFTDCSGWMSFALDSVAPVHQAVAAAHRTEAQFNQGRVATAGGGSVLLSEKTEWGWARAEVLTDLFRQASGANGFQSIPAFADLQAGDVIAYAQGIYADPTGDILADPGLIATGDTGHTMIVAGTPVLVTDPANISGRANLSSDVVAVYAVPVVDSSDLHHGSVPLGYDRTFFVTATDTRTGPNGDRGGGVGTGTMLFGVNAAGQAIQFCFGYGSDGWQPPPGGATTVIAASRLTDTIDLGATALVGGQLLVRVYPNASPVLGGVDHTVVEHLTGAGGLLVDGGGTLSLSGGNSFSGAVEVTGGTTLAIAAGDSLGVAGNAVALDAGATLRTVAGLSFSQGVSVAAGTATIDLSGHAVTAAGALSVAAGATLAVASAAAGGTLAIAPSAGMRGTIAVAGGAALSLSGGTLPGAVVLQSGATLAIQASATVTQLLVAATADVVVAPGATLALTNGVAVSPGSAGIAAVRVSGGGGIEMLAGTTVSSGATLYTGTLAQFDGQALTGFKLGDVIDIAGLADTGAPGTTGGATARYDDATGSLVIAGGGGQATVTLPPGLRQGPAGVPEEFTVRADGGGGTLLQLSAATGGGGSDPLPPGAANPALNFTEASGGQSGVSRMDAAGAGGPDYLKWQFIWGGKDVALRASAPNVFIRTGDGNDAIQVTSGQNVLDGGAGSNYLVGGTGADTFFTDARGSGAVWNTIVNFHQGDSATLWGFDPAVSTYRWDDQPAGAPGATGATLRANIVGGQGRTGDGIDASITFAGLTVEQAKGMVHSTGDIAGGAGKYLYFYNQGV